VRFHQEKIKGREELQHIAAGLARAGKRIVFTNGCFDILHQGHVLYLEEARAKGDCLIVGVNTDASVRQIKGDKKPIISQEGRMIVLAALEADPLALISYLRPHILVKGGDWDPREVVGRELVEETIIIPYVEGHSTTGVIETILQRFLP
jgi:D-beta-D-heptose 7-phosphate kinase/D-beta-D-heptose 1-phosphate adenosyltransferase